MTSFRRSWGRPHVPLFLRLWPLALLAMLQFFDNISFLGLTTHLTATGSGHMASCPARRRLGRRAASTSGESKTEGSVAVPGPTDRQLSELEMVLGASDELADETFKKVVNRKNEVFRNEIELEEGKEQDRYFLVVLTFIGACLAVVFLGITFKDFEENQRAMGAPSYTEYCNTEAFKVKKLFFPNAKCIRPSFVVKPPEEQMPPVMRM